MKIYFTRYSRLNILIVISEFSEFGIQLFLKIEIKKTYNVIKFLNVKIKTEIYGYELSGKIL